MLIWLTVTTLEVSLASSVARCRWNAQRSIVCHLHYRAREHILFFALSSQIKAYKITPTNPPTIAFAWTASQNGQGSPWVTTTDGTNNAIVWVVGAEGDHRLHGYNGDTGEVVLRRRRRRIDDRRPQMEQWHGGSWKHLRRQRQQGL